MENEAKHLQQADVIVQTRCCSYLHQQASTLSESERKLEKRKVENDSYTLRKFIFRQLNS